jgi:hypothetical protein
MAFQKPEQSQVRSIPLFLTLLKREKEAVSSERYLKCWGCDYPYLKTAEGYRDRWLPVPENSTVQRIIKTTPHSF